MASIKIKKIRERDIYVSIGLFFILVSGYFCFFGNYVLYFQETQSLFIFSGDFLHQRLLKPGGLLNYAGEFLKQFYAGRVEGSLVAASVITLLLILFYNINKRLFKKGTFSLPLILIPSFILLLMQANYYHMMEYNLGFILVSAFYLFFISSGKQWRLIAVFIIYPFFYYVTGGYTMIFTGMFIVHLILRERVVRKRIYYSAGIVLIAGLIFLISWKYLFLEPATNLIFYPLPWLEDPSYRIAFILLATYFVFYPLIALIPSRYEGNKFSGRFYSIAAGIGLSAVSVFLLFRIYNPQTSRVVELERLVFSGKFEEAASFHEKKPSYNLIGQYFYNYALAETDQLCSRMFRGSQDFGYSSLILPWGDVHLSRGAYFYYAIGLTNEAHRWAYEDMVVYGYRPENLKMLAKTSLINGDYMMAEKYLNILKKTLYYSKWAKGMLNLAANPEMIDSDPEFGSKRKILPKSNFFVQFNEPQNNLPLILESQPDNRKAFEYYMAGLLLSKNVEEAVGNLNKLKGLGYNSIPRYLEEAALIYYDSVKRLPDLGGLSISAGTQERFRQYFTAYVAARQNPVQLKAKMKEKFSDTFWYYYHFK